MSGAIPRAVLGRTGLVVSQLGYGSLNLGGAATRAGRIVSAAVADRVLHAALDAGITFIDTAPDYGDAEEVIGRVLAARRHEFVLASKCGCPVGALAELPIPADRPRDHFHSQANIRAGVEQSLRRLRTDHLDLVQVHNSPSRAELERNDSITELLALRDEGKVRFIGISSTLPEATEHVEMDVFDVIQVPFSGLQPEHGAVIERAAARAMGVVVRGGLAQGSIATAPGALPGYRQATARRQHTIWQEARIDELLDGLTPMEFMLRLTLSEPGVTTTIVGTADPGHLAENVAAAGHGPLPDSIRREAKDRIRRVATEVA